MALRSLFPQAVEHCTPCGIVGVARCAISTNGIAFRDRDLRPGALEDDDGAVDGLLEAEPHARGLASLLDARYARAVLLDDAGAEQGAGDGGVAQAELAGNALEVPLRRVALGEQARAHDLDGVHEHVDLDGGAGGVVAVAQRLVRCLHAGEVAAVGRVGGVGAREGHFDIGRPSSEPRRSTVGNTAGSILSDIQDATWRSVASETSCPIMLPSSLTPK